MDGWIDGRMDGWMGAKGLWSLKDVREHYHLKSLEFKREEKQRKTQKPHTGLAKLSMSLKTLSGGRAIKEVVKLDR